MSLGAIARAAGVSVPTVRLRYPGGKVDVATAALADMRSRSEQPDSGDLRAGLVEQLQRLRRGLERPFGVAMVGTVLAEEHHTPALLEAFRERVVAPRRRRLLAVLEAGRDRGEVDADADLEAIVALLIGSYYALRLAATPVPPDWPARHVDAVLRSSLPEATP